MLQFEKVKRRVGQYGLGKRNGRGEKLIEFCNNRPELLITNTWFQQEKRRIDVITYGRHYIGDSA